MIEDSCLNERGIGDCGTYTRPYAAYERLSQIASANELFELTKAFDPIIRIYSVRALKVKNDSLFKLAQKRLSKDTATVCWYSGCIKMNGTQVSFFVKD